jgi:hypothetical protein
MNNKRISLLLLNQVGKICDGLDTDIILEAMLSFVAKIIFENYEENADILFSESLIDCIKIYRSPNENI